MASDLSPNAGQGEAQALRPTIPTVPRTMWALRVPWPSLPKRIPVISLTRFDIRLRGTLSSQYCQGKGTSAHRIRTIGNPQRRFCQEPLWESRHWVGKRRFFFAPGSWIGHLPRRSNSIFAGSMYTS